LTAAARVHYHLDGMDNPPLTDDNFRQVVRIWPGYAALQGK